MTLEEAMKLTQVELIDIQKAGCVVIKMIESVPGSYLAEVGKTAKKWAEELGVNVLILPHNMDVNVISHELVKQPLQSQILESLQERIKMLNDRISALES